MLGPLEYGEDGIWPKYHWGNPRRDWTGMPNLQDMLTPPPPPPMPPPPDGLLIELKVTAQLLKWDREHG